MSYTLHFTTQAVKDVATIKKSNAKMYSKLKCLLEELIEHPYTGTGKPERMKHDYASCHSRRITHKHRLVYKILEEKVEVLVVSAYGHYYDK
jgi:toxin YoeB